MRKSNAEFEFLSLLGKFFTEYLPISMNASPNTISSYKCAFRLLFQYLNGTIYLATYENGPVKYPGIEVAEMTKVKKLSTPCDTTPDPKTQEAIQMFKQLNEEEIAAQKAVSIRFHNSATQTVLAIFGEDTILIPHDESHFIANVIGIDREDFYSRIAFFGSHAKIIGPKEILDGYENYIDNIADLYNYDIEPEYLREAQPETDSYNKFMR